MAMHSTNSLLKYVVPAILAIIILLWLISLFHHKDADKRQTPENQSPIKNTATQDNAAESLDTLTAELSETKSKILEVSKTNEVLKLKNNEILEKLNTKKESDTSQLVFDIQQLKEKLQTILQEKTEGSSLNGAVITTVPDLAEVPGVQNAQTIPDKTVKQNQDKIKPVPFYTIPANGTSVKDHLMTALVGRIPIKGIVTDPYPFKIVISDDNLAANGLRIPHLSQMIISGYCEGDLNLVSVRGWVTSLTFVFEDGTISTTTSNDNDIGNFTKANSLGYLSDKFGNPFIRGKLISNAPAYLSGNVAISTATGAANAYAQSQLSSSTSEQGNVTTTVTGSQGQFVAGKALSSASSEVQQWWNDRIEQSFDAIYVAPTNEKDEFIEIAVNFAKEIHIDYNPQGRKLNYAHDDDHNDDFELD